MKTQAGNFRRALVRKIGPLPAWAWLLILAGGLYLYRRRGQSVGATDTANTSATDPSVTDNSGSNRDPVTLDPGQSVYDPSTGQLTGTAPEPLPRQDPVTMDPGQTTYDPNTGQDHTAPEPGKNTKQPAGSKQTGKNTGKTTGKGKGQTKRTAAQMRKDSPAMVKRVKNRMIAQRKQHGKPAGTPTPGKGKPRAGAVVKRNGGVSAPLSTLPAKIRRPRTMVKPALAPGSTIVRSPGSGVPAAIKVGAPAMRQRPAAPLVTHPATQKVAPHPARAATPSSARVKAGAPTPKVRKR